MHIKINFGHENYRIISKKYKNVMNYDRYVLEINFVGFWTISNIIEKFIRDIVDFSVIFWIIMPFICLKLRKFVNFNNKKHKLTINKYKKI